MPRPLLTVDEIMAILPATVPRFAGLREGLSEEQLDTAPEPGEWSSRIQLAHLRAAQDVLGANIRRILAEDRPAWKRLSPRVWQRTSGYNDWAFGDAFEAFSNGRAELLATLAPLGDDAWERVAMVTVAPNRAIEQTARFFGDWLASHEREHLVQLARTIERVSARK